MKFFILTLFIVLSNSAFNQVYGEIFMDKRAIEKKIDFTIVYSKPGKIVFDIKVNIDGKVTACSLNKEKSTITASGPVMKAKNKIMQNLVFTKGIGYPKWHSGYVQIITQQGSLKEDPKFLPPH